MKDQTFNNLVAGLTAVIVIVAVIGLGVSGGLNSQGGGSGAAAAGTTYLNLTIEINNITGAPEYAPANFSLPLGHDVITIVDQDQPFNWTACLCQVTGTEGGLEWVNGTPFGWVDPANVAHTFSIPALGLNVLSPGGSTVSFALDLTTIGEYTWMCLDPCGSNGYTGFPMGVPGYMTGTMSVV